MFRVPLPLPLPDLKEINAYIIVAPDGATLIDPGWAFDRSEAAMLAGLHSVGMGVGDVRRILVTHAHWDHYTQAVKWRAEYPDIEILLGAGERHSIESLNASEGVYPTQAKMLVRAGAPELGARIERLGWAPYEEGVSTGRPDRWLVGGERIDCGPTSLRARATPGHTRGHVIFEICGAGMVFSGDHLLPRITPSLGFERRPERLPLQSFIESLRLFSDLPEMAMLPAHGPLGMSTRARAEELLDHHANRLQRIADLVSGGHSTAYAVARQMRWTRHDRALGELSEIHQMTAILEVRAHLDVLVDRGTVSVDEAAESSIFSLS